MTFNRCDFSPLFYLGIIFTSILFIAWQHKKVFLCASQQWQEVGGELSEDCQVRVIKVASDNLLEPHRAHDMRQWHPFLSFLSISKCCLEDISPQRMIWHSTHTPQNPLHFEQPGEVKETLQNQLCLLLAFTKYSNSHLQYTYPLYLSNPTKSMH